MAHPQDRQATCAERVADAWASELDDMRERLASRDPDEGGAMGYVNSALAFDYVTPGTFDDQPDGYHRLLLSWGGPGSELRFCGEGARVEYWFLDWFDGASIDVTDVPEVRDVVDFLDDIGLFESARDRVMDDL